MDPPGSQWLFSPHYSFSLLVGSTSANLCYLCWLLLLLLCFLCSAAAFIFWSCVVFASWGRSSSSDHTVTSWSINQVCTQRTINQQSLSDLALYPFLVTYEEFCHFRLFIHTEVTTGLLWGSKRTWSCMRHWSEVLVGFSVCMCVSDKQNKGFRTKLRTDDLEVALSGHSRRSRWKWRLSMYVSVCLSCPGICLLRHQLSLSCFGSHSVVPPRLFAAGGEGSTAGCMLDIFGDLLGRQTPSEDATCLFLRLRGQQVIMKEHSRPGFTVLLEPCVLRHVCQHK